MPTCSATTAAIASDEYPTLRSLGLTSDALEVLAQRGTLVVERRGEHRIVKLRFRQGGRHRARCIGDHAVAQVAEELVRLRTPLVQLRRLRQLGREVSRELRTRRAALEPLLAINGFHFHGRTIRRCRDELWGGYPCEENSV